MSTMTLDEKALNIAAMEIVLGGFTKEAWSAYRYGIPLAIALANGDITVAEDSESAGFITEVYDWLEPARQALAEGSED